MGFCVVKVLEVEWLHEEADPGHSVSLKLNKGTVDS